MVDPRFDWGVTRVTPKQFEKQILFLIERGYSVQTLTEYLRSGLPKPSEKRVCLTFDDAYAGIYTWAFPIMARYGLPGTLFVISGYCGGLNTWDVNIGWLRFRHLTWDQIKTLSNAGWEIGSHTVSHRDLTRLSPAELEFEINKSKQIIEQRISRKVSTFSYPFGKINSKVANEVKSAGYEFAVTMHMNTAKLPIDFSIPRLGIYLFDTMFSFRHKVSGKANGIHRATQRLISLCSTGSVIFKESL